MWDLSSLTRDQTLAPLHYKCRVLTTAPPWKALCCLAVKYKQARKKEKEKNKGHLLADEEAWALGGCPRRPGSCELRPTVPGVSGGPAGGGQGQLFFSLPLPDLSQGGRAAVPWSILSSFLG